MKPGDLVYWKEYEISLGQPDPIYLYSLITSDTRVLYYYSRSDINRYVDFNNLSEIVSCFDLYSKGFNE
jgi:hypothetical protein